MARSSAGPALPPEAKENGGDVNSQGLEESRVSRTVREEDLAEGPKVGERGEYQKAAYRIRSGNIRIDA